MIHRCMTSIAVAAITASVGLSGCNDSTNSASPDSQLSSTSAQPTLQVLQTGNYPTKPQPPRGAAGDGGAIIEAQRMADYVVGPWEVDPNLVARNGSTLVLKDTAAVGVILDSAAAPIVAEHHFVNGFVTERAAAGGTGALKDVRNAVLRFPDQTTARSAAAELAQGLRGPADGAGQQSISIDNHPDTFATASDLPGGTYDVTSWTATGPYVIAVAARTPESRDASALLVSKLLDLQVRRISDFEATDPAEFTQLPIDPTGLLVRTLPPANAQELPVNAGVWRARADLHYQANPIDEAKLFTAAGVDAVSVRKTTVYRAKDTEGADFLADKTAVAVGANAKPTDSVPGLDAAKCFDAGPDNKLTFRYSCVAPVDRYVVTASSAQSVDVQQQIAAQVMMLGGK